MFLINNNNFRTKNKINPAYYFLMFNKRNCVSCKFPGFLSNPFMTYQIILALWTIFS